MSRFRSEYRQLTDNEKLRIETIKRQATDLAMSFAPGGTTSRELSIALTKLEEAVMWAVKGITG